MNDDDDAAIVPRRKDPVVGIDVGGERVFYCRLSTLTSTAESYFASRFDPDGMCDPDVEYTDDKGRPVYFVDRCPKLFEFILQYLRTQKLPPSLGDFYENTGLWRALRIEAEFFGLEGLLNLLSVTYTCSPETNGDRGILHWLGTNKGESEYENPFVRGDIDVGGWVDDDVKLRDYADNLGIYMGDPKSRELFVQYRPAKHLLSCDDDDDDGFCFLSSCTSATERLPIVVDFRAVTIRPAHFSLRYGGCQGMHGDWNLEGSEDGQNWDVLHEARGETHLLGAVDDGEKRWLKKIKEDCLDGGDGFLLDYSERHHRHLWRVEPSSFYRYIRLIGAGSSGDERSCLHTLGLEIFGLVSEV